MERDDIIEKLEKLGYDAKRIDGILALIDDLETRKALIECEGVTLGDIALVSMMFDLFVKKSGRK